LKSAVTRSESEARIEGAMCPRTKGKAQTESKAREKEGEPLNPPRNFEKI